MDAGAFSDDKVVKAATQLVTILIKDDNKDYEMLDKKFDVKGFPTVLFLDKDGEKVDEMENRKPDAVLKQINDIADKYNKKKDEKK